MSSGYEDDVQALLGYSNAKGISSGYWNDVLLELGTEFMRMMCRF